MDRNRDFKNKDIKNKEYKNIYQKAPDIALTVMLVLALAGLGLISYLTVTGTYLERRFAGQASVYISDDPMKQLLVFGIFLLAVLISGAIWDKRCRSQDRAADLVLMICTVLSIIAGFAFLNDHPYYMDGDQINTFYAGVYATEEGARVQYEMFQPGGYIGIYPQQKGLVMIYYLLYHVFGEDMYNAIQYLHLLYPVLILNAGYRALKEEKVSPFARIIYCIMILTCVPLYIYIPYMYGDLGSAAFTFCFAYFLTKYFNTGKALHVIPMCLCGMMAILLRTSAWIFLIAVMIIMTLEYLRRRKVMIFVTGICALLTAFLACVLVQGYFEEKSGYRDVDGIPAVCWVAMGLQETNGDPGVYNRYNQGTFEACGFDADKASDVAKDNIRNSIKAFRKDSAHAKWFFETKLRQEWTSPDMEGLWMTSVWDAKSGTEPIAAPGWLDELYSSGPLYDNVINFANRYQTVVYLSGVLTVIFLFFRKKSEMPLLTQLSLIYFLGGLLFFTVWENKSRYILPYYVFLILLIPYAADALRKLFKKREEIVHF